MTDGGSGREPLARLRTLPLLLLFGLIACTSGGRVATGLAGPESGPPLSVITSITVLADLIRQVGGDRVEVKALVPSGADPNTFQPAPRDVVSVSHAGIVFFNGLGLDRTVRTVVSNAARPELPVVVLADGLPTIESDLTAIDRGPGAARGNPYLWLDPRNARVYVERIRDGLTAVDPAGAGSYRENAAGYLDLMSALDDELAKQVATITPRRRKLVTLHDAFPYLAERYGLELVGVVIKTPGRQPSAQEVADVSRAMRQYEVPTVFTEPQLDARLLKLAARDAGINISTLYSDTLDQAVPTYEALLRYNAMHLVNGLQ